MLDWLTHDVQAHAAANGYVPLPAQVQQLARTMLQQITGPAGTHPLLTAAAAFPVGPGALPGAGQSRRPGKAHGMAAGGKNSISSCSAGRAATAAKNWLRLRSPAATDAAVGGRNAS
jgi:hypothetical protein